MIEHRISPLEAVGLRPLLPGLRDCARAVVGDPHTPPASFGLSSLRIFRPRLGPATWAGWSRRDRRVPILNYYNRRLGDPRAPYDVRVTTARDWRGRQVTYNSHNGTDLVVPVGTPVVAPAPGRVVRVQNLMNRGGLKLMIDHGDGLVTLCGHLSRALVSRGDPVARGERIGLSGFSAVDGILFFPWVPPHVHMTVLLDGAPVDPFAADGEVALWRGGNRPGPAPFERASVPWDALRDGCVDEALERCADPRIRAQIDDPWAVVFWVLHHPWAFEGELPVVYAEAHARAPQLDLPFAEFDSLAI